MAYNREKALKKLLDSLSQAYYDNSSVELIISIDKSDNFNVCNVAKEFNWENGNKRVLIHDKNLGLRKHILKCGDLATEYDAVIILEDDLVVSKSFYRYAKQSYEYYKNNQGIAGISLYTYRVNEFSNLRPFIPMQDDSDVYFAMVPSSWGQMWTKDQWIDFKTWYEKGNIEMEEYRGVIPDVVLGWKETSWKKYFHAYLADRNKYFVYPRIALSTNMGNKGVHNNENSSAHQSILMGDFNREYIFKRIDDPTAIKYDSCFESLNLKDILELDDTMTVDYYGGKYEYTSTGYLLSIRVLNYKIIGQWGLELVPYELNIMNNIKGLSLFLYNLSVPCNNPRKKTRDRNDISLIKYEIPSMTKERAFKMSTNEYFNAIKRRMRKIFIHRT